MSHRNNKSFYIYVCSFIFGLLLTKIFSLSQGMNLIVGILFITIIVSFLLSSFIKLRVKNLTYVITSLIIISSFYYCHWRTVLPHKSDISNQVITSQNFIPPVTVSGLIITNPRLNQNNNVRFVLQAQEIIINNIPEKVTGKIYITAPLLSVTGLYPSTSITVKGKLYKPNPPLNPGGFNFGEYLAREGIFSGLSANFLEVNKEGNIWQKKLFYLRQRIIQSHVRFLNVPYGNLVSSMVIGSRAVDLDLDLQNGFRTAGLAHILASSGFHVSLLLGTVLYLTKSSNPRNTLIIGLVTLFIYVTLTGFYPSILRACFMGVGVLIAMVNDLKVKSSASLLLAALILLLINPLWIWDLGFQLSFLATWGLIVTLPSIVNRLDFLPPTIANLMAVSTAATIWTLPLICYAFNRIPVYGIFTNILATPLVIIITLGGFISGFLGVIFPWMGSAIAYLLFMPIWLLIQLVEISNKLPFSSLAVGELSIFALIFAYGILLFITFNKWSQKKWLWLIIFGLSLYIIPLIYQKFNLIQVTIMATRNQPVVMIQNQGKNVLINLNDKNNVRFNIVALLQNQGINQLDLVLTPDNKDNKIALNVLQKYIFIKNINVVDHKSIKAINIIEKNSDFIIFELLQKKWLIILTNKLKNLPTITNYDIVSWSNNSVNQQQIKQINPKIAIANMDNINQEIVKYLESKNIEILPLQKGAIQWQPTTGFNIYSNDV